MIWNIPSGAPVFPFTSPLTTMFVLVPMRVHKPPRTTAAFIGIRSFETLKRCFFAQSRIAGTISATTGVLFMKADTKAGPTIVRSCAEASVAGRPSTRSTTVASAPVRSTAAATTNSAATVIIPSLAIPLRASSGVRIPAARSTTTPPIIAMSGPRWPMRSATSVAQTTSAVSRAGQSPAGAAAASSRSEAGIDGPGRRLVGRGGRRCDVN